MRYAQIELTEEEFIELKKAALDAKLSLKDFLKSAIFEKMFLDIMKKEQKNLTEEKDFLSLKNRGELV